MNGLRITWSMNVCCKSMINRSFSSNCIMNELTFEDHLRSECYDRAHDGLLTLSDAKYLITEHGLTYREVFNDIGDSLLNVDVILEYLGY